MFLTCDALIHDSASFIVEYLYTGKPSLFLAKDTDIRSRFNEIGNKALDVLYIGNNKTDIYNFINEVVLSDIDNKKFERLNFYENIVKPPNNDCASNNIVNHLKTELGLS